MAKNLDFHLNLIFGFSSDAAYFENKMHVAKLQRIFKKYYCQIPYVKRLLLRPPPNQNSSFYLLLVWG